MYALKHTDSDLRLRPRKGRFPIGVPQMQVGSYSLRGIRHAGIKRKSKQRAGRMASGFEAFGRIARCCACQVGHGAARHNDA